jgi:SAM-dependent methyltransferase
MSDTPPLRDDWNTLWKQNAAAASENPAQRYRHSLILGWLERLAFGKKGSLLIDFGSGQGDFLVKASQQFPQSSLVGFELSREGVLMTAQKAPGARVLELDLFQPTPEAKIFRSSATHAACSEVLEHLDDPGGFLRAMTEYLAPGAHLIITVPGGPMSAFDRQIGHRQHFTVERLRQLVEANGLEWCRAQRAGFPFHNLYRLLVIARGGRLTEDIRRVAEGGGGLAGLAMRLFGVLFQANLPASPWGWQLVAWVRKQK